MGELLRNRIAQGALPAAVEWGSLASCAPIGNRHTPRLPTAVQDTNQGDDPAPQLRVAVIPHIPVAFRNTDRKPPTPKLFVAFCSGELL